MSVEFEALQRLVDKQAEDPALWCVAGTAVEAYIQRELRKLHWLIEELNPNRSAGESHAAADGEG